MGPRHTQGLLLLFLLGASSSTEAPEVQCFKNVSMYIEEKDYHAFTWTTENVETCDNVTFCQESILIIKAGTKTAILATKGCIPATMEEIMYIQHTPPPGLVAVSYSSYCDKSVCNDKDRLNEFGNLQEIPVTPTVSPTLQCPTCVALGTCDSAPSLPCPQGATRCYEGRLEIAGGGIESSVEVKGCTALMGCRLMAGMLTVGPMLVKEICQNKPLTQTPKAESGATCLPILVWRLHLLLPLVLESLVHFS
ncbi:testis-expressed protein 101 [Otolemur garnettii]|uniref:testis-expressed protein 101 n=1 Tax=Otolemur garnettii TaxID=30611 RepID=UPI00027420C2|nr:testis-expressed protein 101 [Otolemur garnettii]